ncbi:Mur ligase domain-containing protein, partial [Duncaniella freteri]
MQLNKLLSPVEISEIIGCGDKEITGVTADSRQVRDGYMFVAVPGVSVDG